MQKLKRWDLKTTNCLVDYRNCILTILGGGVYVANWMSKTGQPENKMIGNIIIGGGIGAMIDHSKGTGYNYPDQLSVEMGKAIVIDRAAQDATARGAQ